MAWNLSTAATQALLGAAPTYKHAVVSSGTISFGDGDGSVIAGADTIKDSANGLIGFNKHAWVLIISPAAAGGTNTNLLVKALDVEAGKIEVVAGAFTAEVAGSLDICLVQLNTGSVRELFQNGTLDLYTGSRPTTSVAADQDETGDKVLSLTLNNGAFVATEDTNGLNLGAFSGNTMKRGIDPLTGITEVWKGIGLSPGGTAGWGRWYANDKVTGPSSSAIRMDGVVSSVFGSDIYMANGTNIVIGVYSEVTDVSMTLAAA